MSKNKRPKKKHRPTAYQINPLAMLRDHSTETLSPSQLRDLMIGVHSSLKSIEDGQGAENDVIQLAIASNIALVLAENGMGAEFIPEVKEAQRYILVLQAQHEQEGVLALAGPGITAIRRMLELHDEQIKLAPEGDMRRALRIIRARMDAGHVELPKEK